MSTMFVFVLAMLVGPNPVMGTDVVLLDTYDTMKSCETVRKLVIQDAKDPELQLACWAIAKPGVYRDNDEI